MNILLTGATGFIGNCMLCALSKRHHFCAISRTENYEDSTSVHWLKADLSLADMNLTFPDGIDAVVYLAQSGSYRDFPDKALDIFHVNTASVATFLDMALRNGVKKFVYASSANVYGRSCERITEDTHPNPSSFYGVSKLMAETLMKSYAPFFKCIVLRLFTVYGPGQRDMLIPSLINAVINKKPIRIEGNDGLKLSPVYVTDVVNVIEAILGSEDDAPGFDVLNVGGDEIVSIHDISETIGRALNILPVFDFADEVEPGGYIADCSKLRRTFELGKFILFDAGMKNVVRQYKDK